MVAFAQSQLNASIVNPTSLQFGRDGRLYASEADGTIKIFTIGTTSTGYTVTATETINLVAQMPNHNDDGTFNPNDWMEPKEQRKVDDFIIYAMAAAEQALADAGWKPAAYEDQIRTGVLIGSGIGGLQGIEKTSLLFAEKGPRRVSPFFIPGRLINLAAGYVSIEH